jgi:membrane protease YdiL (CAAX protease family)
MRAPPARPSRLEEVLGPAASATLRDSAKVILWGLVLYGLVEFVGNKLSAKATGALAAQMVIAEWGAGRLAVAWSDPSAPVATFGSIVQRAGKGAALGILAAALVVAFAIATGAMVAHPNRPDVGELAIGLVSAALVAARDELLFRGVVIRAFRHACPTAALLAICGGAAAAAEYGALEGAVQGNGPRLLVAALLGTAFAALWLRDRGAWLAFGAHTGWSLASGTAIGGGLLDLRASNTPWGGGNAGISGSLAAIPTVLALTALAVGWSRGREKTVRSASHVGK